MCYYTCITLMKDKAMHRIKLNRIVATASILALIAGPAQAASATTINFDLNGVAPVVHTAESTGSVKIPTIELDFDNMSFEGWNTSPTGSGRSYKAGDTVSSNTTLYAQWADGTSGDPDTLIQIRIMPNLVTYAP